MPSPYWISMNFCKNSTSKAKRTWKITHLAQPFYLRDEKMEIQRKELTHPKTQTRVRTWAKIQPFNSDFSFPMSKSCSILLMTNEPSS